MDHLAALGREASAFYGSAASHLHLGVPSCPGWDVGDLVWHIGYVHRFWRIVAEGVEDEEGAAAIERLSRPGDGALVPWAEHETDLLLGALQELDPAARRWNWSREPDLGAWIPRRMAHETAVHRWDLQNAVGHPDSIAPDLAADGVDEYLRVFVPVEDGYHGPEGVVRLEATDTDASWTVLLAPPHPTVVDEPNAEPDETIALGAHEILLTLWGRFEFDGDLLTALIEHADLE